jgi:cytochrome c biogenesis protein CcmG/thiol:disulfide interchange protein DsbE
MRRRRRYMQTLLIGAILAALSFAHPASAAAAPDFTLPTRDGTLSLDSLHGKVVLVDFWASWCEPCRRSFPWLSSLQEQYRNQGLVVVGINLDKTRQAADGFLNKIHAGFSVVFDPAAKTAEAYDVKAMPTSFIIDRNGQIVYTHLGYDDKHAQAVEALLPTLLAK